MANTLVEFDSPIGLTLTLKLYAYGADTQLASVSSTEKTNDKGRYSSTVTAGLTGWHHARIIDASNNLIARGAVFMRDDTMVHYVQDTLDPKGQQISSHEGVAAAGSTNTITLGATAVATDDYYKDHAVRIIRGTGVGQVRAGNSYVGATKVLTVNTNWAITPDTTSEYQLIGYLPT